MKLTKTDWFTLLFLQAIFVAIAWCNGKPPIWMQLIVQEMILVQWWRTTVELNKEKESRP